MKYMIFILMLLLMAAPVTAVTYSEEYYMITEKSNQWFSTFENVNKMSYRAGDILSAYELRRQTILMEKQNELLEEQNMLLRNLTNARLVGYFDSMTYAPAGYKVTT